MIWLALCLAIAVAVTVWLWGRAALRRSVSHADLPNGPGILPIPTADAGDDLGRELPLGAALQEEQLTEAEAADKAGSPEIPGAEVEISAPAQVPSAQPLVQAGALWVEESVEIEPGLGVVCAKANHYRDELFSEAQNHLKNDLNLFLISKDDRDAVFKKECGLLLASRLSDLQSNGKIQDAYAIGVPVLLAEDVGDCRIGDTLKGHFSQAGLEEYQRARSAFEVNWEMVSYRLQGNDRYFLTHSDSGYKLLSKLEDYLKETLGPKQEINRQIVPKGKQLDFVVVPTLRTTSSKFISVLAREVPVLAIRSYDLEGRSVGDEVPAWRWKGGEFFLYPTLKRDRINEA